MQKPMLYGLSRSNRDFSQRDSWGKNQFNSSFPAALCCYMSSKGISANYLAIENAEPIHKQIAIRDIFGIETDSPASYFAFESAYSPFQKYVLGSLPRTDLVVQDISENRCLAGLEIKLTALPDNTTCNLSEDRYGSELVVRPDSIVYLACSLAESLGRLKVLRDGLLIPNSERVDWSDPQEVVNLLPLIGHSLSSLLANNNEQRPFLLQPVWKTEGKSPRLAENCLDVFCWSDLSFLNFILTISRLNNKSLSITRQSRTAVWLYKMLEGIASEGKFNHRSIIDMCSYNTKNDKAFASSGVITNHFMRCDRLLNPIVSRDEIKNIILGGGQDLLSPERRFDAIICNSPEIFL